MAHTRAHALTGAVAIAALVGALLLPAGGSVLQAAPGDACGLTTLDATVVDDGNGRLTCGPGQDIVVREDLAEASADRETARDPLVSFMGIADFQLADEESPLRGEWADKCDIDQTDPGFRPHETMVPHLINAHVRAANALASNPSGSPVLHDRYSFVVQLGDAADNQQYNEVRAFIDLLDGGTLVDPDSGAEGYEGVQAKAPIASPVSGRSVLELANDPFWATGLRTANGAPIPWYSVIGNHDIKVQGTLPDNDETWRTFARAWVRGSIKVQDLAPDHQERVCDDPSVLADPSFWTEVAAFPGSTALITPDEDRRLLDREGWIQEHFTTSGIPAGHGFAPQNRCTDPDGEPLARGCYSWNQGALHFIVLDTSASEGLETGNIDPAQFDWLESDLRANSSRYFDADGDERSTTNPDRLTVVFTHHALESTTNAGSPRGERPLDGAALRALLLRFPNVILQVSGHTHDNKIWPYEDSELGTAYWEINTASVADWPTQSRSIEIADNHDGTLSIIGLLFDAAVAPNPRDIEWSADLTDETSASLGAAAVAINEDWLASAGREVGFRDRDADRSDGRTGAEDERNVELILDHPWGVTAAGSTVLPHPPATFQPPPLSPFLGLPSGFPGGIPQIPSTDGYDWQQPPEAGAFPPSPYSSVTGPGLGAPIPASTGSAARAGLLFLSAAAGTAWLLQARVRRHMVGI